jgi:hypothetical protein
MNKVAMEDVYSPSSVAERNVTTWLMSKNVGTGSSNVASVSIMHPLVQWTLIFALCRSLNLASDLSTIRQLTWREPGDAALLRLTKLGMLILAFSSSEIHTVLYPPRPLKRVTRLPFHPNRKLSKDQ